MSKSAFISNPTRAQLRQALGFEAKVVPMVSSVTGLTTGKAEVWRDLRMPEQAVIGEVGVSWTPLQPETLIEYADRFVASSGATIDSAGYVDNGGIIYVSLQLDELDLGIAGGINTLRNKLLLSVGFNERHSFQVNYHTYRPICRNTLNRAMAEGDKRRAKHTSTIEVRSDYIIQCVDLAHRSFKDDLGLYRKMAATRLTDSKVQLRALINTVFAGKADSVNENKIEKLILPHYELERDRQGDTVFSAYQAINAYINHDSSRHADNTVKFVRTAIGTGATQDAKALRAAMALL